MERSPPFFGMVMCRVHPRSEGVYKLPPAGFVKIASGGGPEVGAYWDLAGVVSQGQLNTLRADKEGLVDELETLLHDAVSRRMIADVPRGGMAALDPGSRGELAKFCETYFGVHYNVIGTIYEHRTLIALSSSYARQSLDRHATNRPRSHQSGLSPMGRLNCLAFGDHPGIAR